MVLAAGVGARLRPLTDRTPKALIEVGGTPMLEIVLKRLIEVGVKEVIVNTHHLPDQITDFLKAKKNFGLHIEISHEPELLDTGGGLKKAAAFLEGSEPFYLHNVDVLSDIDLKRFYRFHQDSGALATLAVQKRESGRYLLFNAQGFLCGWESVREGKKKWASGVEETNAERLAFGGVHVISPAFFSKLGESGVFSITQAYLRLAGAGEKIQAFRVDKYYWCDIGSSVQLKEARKRFAKS